MEIKDIPMAAIAIAMAVIIITVFSLIISGVQDETSDFQATLSNNQTLTWLGNNTAMTFTEGRVIPSSVVLYNNGTVVSSVGNYTVTATGLTVTNVSPTNDPEWVTGTLNVTYSYNFGSAAYNATREGLGANQTLSSFLPLIALVVIGAIIIGIVTMFFRMP